MNTFIRHKRQKYNRQTVVYMDKKDKIKNTYKNIIVLLSTMNIIIKTCVNVHNGSAQWTKHFTTFMIQWYPKNIM